MSDTPARSRSLAGGVIAFVLGAVAVWAIVNAYSYASNALTEATIREGQNISLIYGLWALTLVAGLAAAFLGLRSGHRSRGYTGFGDVLGMVGWVLGTLAAAALLALLTVAFVGLLVSAIVGIVLGVVVFFGVPILTAALGRRLWMVDPEAEAAALEAQIDAPPATA